MKYLSRLSSDILSRDRLTASSTCSLMGLVRLDQRAARKRVASLFTDRNEAALLACT